MASTRTKAEMFSLAHDILNGSQTHRAGNTNSMKTLQQGDMLTVIGHEQEGFVIIANDSEVRHSHQLWSGIWMQLTRR